MSGRMDAFRVAMAAEDVAHAHVRDDELDEHDRVALRALLSQLSVATGCGSRPGADFDWPALLEVYRETVETLARPR